MCTLQPCFLRHVRPLLAQVLAQERKHTCEAFGLSPEIGCPGVKAIARQSEHGQPA
jgi:hypothetical protein